MEFISISFLNIFIIIFIFSISIETNRNNIIKINKQKFRYVNFAKNSKGDMIFYSTALEEYNNQRLFYGFKKDGRPLFENANYFKIIISNIPCQKKYESKIIFIKPNSSCENEYLMSVGKESSTVEIYDFDNNIIYRKPIERFSNLKTILSFRNEAFLLNNYSNYYLFGFTFGDDNEVLHFSLQEHQFEFSLENFETIDTSKREHSIDNPFSEKIGISCFKTDGNNIMCFYLKQDRNYYIFVYDSSLNDKRDYLINVINNLSTYEPFYKCIHLKGEIGVFSYYSNDLRPTFLFRKYENNNINNHTIPKIILKNTYQLINFISDNDIIKLDDNKICFSSIEKNKKKIYVILIILYEIDKDYQIRYYSLNLYDIGRITLHLDLVIHNYNNLIALGFSHFNNIQYGENDDKYYSALMILSYPNSTDKECNLYEYFKNNTNSTINDFRINLEDEMRIENNLFGYIFSGIVLTNFENCNNPAFISSLYNKNIGSIYSLQKNEKLKLSFNPNNIYSSFNCSFQYYYKVTEPDKKEYDDYP